MVILVVLIGIGVGVFLYIKFDKMSISPPPNGSCKTTKDNTTIDGINKAPRNRFSPF